MKRTPDCLVDSGLTQESADPLAMAAATAVDEDPINILIVDDEPKNLTVLETILDNPGYRLVRAGSADQALLALVADEFALLILDIRMPGMNGFELAQVIKQRKKTARVPIIFLTAYYNEDQHVLEGYDTGAVDYLQKPVNPAILRSKVAVFAQLHRTTLENSIANRALLAEVVERTRAQEQLRELNETLEQRVVERTQALRASEERFHTIAENIPQLAWMADADGCLRWFNQRWLDFTGTTLEENLGAGWKAVHHPDHVDRVVEKFERHLREGNDWEDSFPLRGRDGRFSWFLSRMRVIRDESGKVVRFFGTNTDVTEQLQVELALRESEERYRTLFAAAPIAVLVCDRYSVIVHYNRNVVELLGREPACGLERQFESISLRLPDGSPLPLNQSPLSEVLRTGVPIHNLEVLIERRDGSRVPALANAAALKNAQGEVTGAIISFIDITARKRAELELIAANAAAVKANRAKSEFLSSMSHELRTPLGSILGFAQLLDTGSPPPTFSQKRSINLILKSGWYLLQLIDEILDLAVIESGKVSIAMESISLDGVMRECHSMMEPQAQNRGIHISFSPSDTPCFVKGDRKRVKQIFINLMTNAIKYNKAGGTVSVDLVASSPGRIRICIRDTGEGLAQEQLDQLFQPFNRLGREVSSEKGTGIGLVTTKRLVELMGGTIGAHSVVGVGSEFWFELNLAVEPQASQLQTDAASPQAEGDAVVLRQASPDSPPRTVLFVEDNPANVELVECLIAGRPDLSLLSAADGELGIELARAHKPHVILMDINLPGISGIECLKILRAEPSTAHIPIVALSADALPDDIEYGLEAGFFSYITKPFTITLLMETLDGALDYSQSAPGRTVGKEQA